MELINLNELTGKDKIAQIANNIVSAVNDGEIDIIKAAVTIKTLSKALEDAEGALKKQIVSEVEKYGKQGYEGLGVTMSVMEAGVNYDFSNCGDTDLEMLEKQMEVLKKKIDSRKTFLKTVDISGQDYLTSDGEVIKVYPPQKKSTTTYKVTFNK